MPPKRQTYVYCITCAVNGKRYIGITTKSVEKRLVEHGRAARRGVPFALYSAMRKYGVEAFAIECLETCDGIEIAKRLEVRHIAQLGTMKGGYNMTAGGDGFRALIRTDEHKRKIGLAHEGKVLSEETKRKLAEYSGERASFYGRKQSPEWHAMMTNLLATDHPMKRHRGDNSKCAKSYVVTDPFGTEYRVTGLREFCRQHGLLSSGLSAVVTGRQSKYKGWKARHSFPEFGKVAA